MCHQFRAILIARGVPLYYTYAHTYILYLTPSGASELVRLTLRSAGKLSDTLQVTLRRRGEGFGLHLSTGLPPITVNYVEPGEEVLGESLSNYTCVSILAAFKSAGVCECVKFTKCPSYLKL